MDEITTLVERTKPWIHVELANGRVRRLLFGRVAPEVIDEFIGTLQQTLTEALTQHANEVVAKLLQQTSTEPNPDRDLVLAFTEEQLAQAARWSAAHPVPDDGNRLLLDQVDGRDESGDVHVSVLGSRVVLLEIEPGVLSQPQHAGWALRDALNLALERRSADLEERAERLRQNGTPQPAPDWAGWARQVKRLRQGYS